MTVRKYNISVEYTGYAFRSMVQYTCGYCTKIRFVMRSGLAEQLDNPNGCQFQIFLKPKIALTNAKERSPVMGIVNR